MQTTHYSRCTLQFVRLRQVQLLAELQLSTVHAFSWVTATA
ncbi:MAG TPA: hypothetical protein QGF58_28285 [Myxococcota bacterium]|nr:hypothetical protein [Myxococcota bacterium]